LLTQGLGKRTRDDPDIFACWERTPPQLAALEAELHEAEAEGDAFR
jgi:hypothetical protein